MTTILTVYKKGTWVGRCDRTCYDAQGPTCTCICEGRNHGKGENHAIRHAPALARLLGKNPQAVNHEFRLHCTTFQLCLFPPDTDSSSDSTPQETSDPSPSLPPGPKGPSGS